MVIWVLASIGIALVLLRLAMPGRWDRLLQVLILVTYTALAAYSIGHDHGVKDAQWTTSTKP